MNADDFTYLYPAADYEAQRDAVLALLKDGKKSAAEIGAVIGRPAQKLLDRMFYEELVDHESIGRQRCYGICDPDDPGVE